MKRIVFIFGSIAGLIEVAMFFITMPLMGDGTLAFENGEIIGYSTMIVALSMIFFGVKSFRDNHNEGKITFGKAFQVGIFIALVASAIYALGWEAYMATGTGPDDFMEQYTDQYVTQMESEGASQSEIDEMKSEMQSMSEMYKNPVIRFGMTLMEILPVGLVITLITAAAVRRSEVKVSV
ncbi:MAG TPA: DUF4199 domain-containing protein [Cyclobacteriaceae bacterium]|nr:DUF4199 domain-containing protein [Cyclobacteriaceae bacterium]HRX00905.1 DUF4199 domain-containing protein [Cyclobacteriaceae bacterium]